MEICTIKNLSFTYPKQKQSALTNINLSISSGEFAVIFGSSGSGKTTLLKMLKKEMNPHGDKTGEVYYQDVLLDALSDRVSAQKIGYVSQNPKSQITTDKVWHELAFGLENLGLSTADMQRRVAEVANYFGIHHWYHYDTHKLSGGQQQLLNVASILAMEPDIILLDEPTSQLDPIAARQFIQMLHHLNQDFGITIVMVEHRLEEVISMANQVILLENGKILHDDTPREIGDFLYRHKHSMFTALPTATKMFYQLGGVNKAPVTVREGREFLRNESFFNASLLEEMDESLVQSEASVLLEVKSAWFSYTREGHDILQNMSFKIKQGEIMSILGANGAGKTTLLNVLSGQYKLYRGKVFYRHKNIRKYKGEALYYKEIAVLPQDPLTLFTKETVISDYQAMLKSLGLGKEISEQKIEEITGLLKINHLLSRHPYDLSGGEIQKVSLGKLLLLDPKLLLLDEPTKGTDAFFKRQFKEILQGLQAQGKTILMISHDIEFVAQSTDRVGLFFDGKILATDCPQIFFSENIYYTTAMRRISRGIAPCITTIDDLLIRFKAGQIYENK